MKLKRCNLCGRLMAATPTNFSFYTNRRVKGTTTGLRGTCKKCMAERTARHSRANPGMVAARTARRRAAEAAAEGSYSAADISAIRRRLKDRCFYCGAPLNGKEKVEHMIPLSKGGSNRPTNLTLACRTCNLDKHSKTALEFFIWREERNLPIHHRDRKSVV